jgi:hypothetical protein
MRKSLQLRNSKHQLLHAKRQLPIEHPDGHKSVKQLERANRELLKLQNAQKLELNRKLVANQEPGPILRKGVPRAVSADGGVSKAFVPGSPNIQVKLLICTPSANVEAKARVILGCEVELDEPWPRRVCKLRKAVAPRSLNHSERATTADVVQEVRVFMTMRYSTIRGTLQNIVIPLTSVSRHVMMGWGQAVDSRHITDPNIRCRSRDWNEYDIGDDDDTPIEIEEGVEVFLGPPSKTSPEVAPIAISWDGFDAQGVTPFHLRIDQEVHREEPRSHVSRIWAEHHTTRPEHAQMASQLFTDENEHYWTDQAKTDANPPLQPGLRVSFQLKPWSKENPSERQRKRPKPPPADQQDPLGPFSHCQTAPTVASGGALDTSGGALETSGAPGTSDVSDATTDAGASERQRGHISI